MYPEKNRLSREEALRLYTQWQQLVFQRERKERRNCARSIGGFLPRCLKITLLCPKNKSKVLNPFSPLSAEKLFTRTMNSPVTLRHLSRSMPEWSPVKSVRRIRCATGYSKSRASWSASFPSSLLIQFEVWESWMYAPGKRTPRWNSICPESNR